MNLGVKLASLRHKKARLMVQGQSNTFQYLKEHLDGKSQYIWMHVSSLGEFEQGRPLIEKIKAEHPDQRILLTFFSPS
ncbi:MAG: 3-deoxy-D-manno-octulosonic acid transferase, partial [Muribaculaceae bacterium]|nr:3-deoxy-D-manno-octulosonic acid transferase [Muribaculaceae bacterium]